MPYKFETQKLRVGKDRDKRFKLSDEDRATVRELYGIISQRKLSKMFNVSRSLIRIVGDPKIAKRVKENLKRNNELNNHYYDRKKHNKAMKNHRDHLKKIYKTKPRKCI